MKDMGGRHTSESTMKGMKECEVSILRVQGNVGVSFKPFVLFMVGISF